jgi:hypothetical protein
MALGSCSTAASCSRLVDENGPAPSTGGRRRASTWQLQLSHCSLGRQSHVRRCPADDQRRSGLRLGSFSARKTSQGVTSRSTASHHCLTLSHPPDTRNTAPAGEPRQPDPARTRQEQRTRQPGNPQPGKPGSTRQQAAPGAAPVSRNSTRQHPSAPGSVPAHPHSLARAPPGQHPSSLPAVPGTRGPGRQPGTTDRPGPPRHPRPDASPTRHTTLQPGLKTRLAVANRSPRP